MTHPITDTKLEERNQLLSHLHAVESRYGHARRNNDWVSTQAHAEEAAHLARLLFLNEKSEP